MAIAAFASRIFSGGSAADRLTLADLAAAGSSPLTAMVNNVARLDATGAQAHDELFMAGTSFLDLSGAILVLRNTENNEPVNLQLFGDAVVGGDDELVARSAIFVVGPYDLSDTHLSHIEVLASGAKLVCNGSSRMVWKVPHTQTAYAVEPGARSVLRVANANAGSRLQLSFLGGPAAEGANWESAALNGVNYSERDKKNGSFILELDLRANVPTRDLLVADGYIDVRMVGANWAPPTRGRFISWGGQKWSGEKAFTDGAPLVFGEAASAFEVGIGRGGASGYWLHAIRANAGTGRIVYLNLAGPDFSSAFAAFGNERAVKIENHLIVDAEVVDANGAAVNAAKVTLTCRNPSYAADDASAGAVQFLAANEKTLTSYTNAEGKASFGGSAGASAAAVCVEAFMRVQGSGGNVDGAYANLGHTQADYASHTALTYGVFAWGKKFKHGQNFAAAKSGATGAGKQTIGRVELEDDPYIASATPAAAPTTITTLDDIWEMYQKYCYDNGECLQLLSVADGVLTCSVSMDLRERDSLFEFAGFLISLNSDSNTVVTVGEKIKKLVFTIGRLTLNNGISITAPVQTTAGTTGAIEIACAANGAGAGRLSVFAADGAQLATFAPPAATQTVTLTAAQAAAGIRIAQTKAGHYPVAQTLNAAGGGNFNVALAAPRLQTRPDGSNMRVVTNAADLSAAVAVAFDFSNLAAPRMLIDIGNGRARAQEIYDRVAAAMETADGAKFAAFTDGLQTLSIFVSPTAGDELYLPLRAQLRRAAAGDVNAEVTARVETPGAAAVDETNGAVRIVAGVDMATLQERISHAILRETDLDDAEEGVQALGPLVLKIREYTRIVNEGFPVVSSALVGRLETTNNADGTKTIKVYRTDNDELAFTIIVNSDGSRQAPAFPALQT